ncbi:uncharacterized protein LOC126328046 [Schistocerca gregaria]|uniref:uncharacterized protein LOC126328046 n=1 Tax=Schistocerca gregaria TaxID=7010 RepID=UPI00211ED53A|nr:uncharacterized protein LOC126328046 [Schistocerca gregaria]
MGRNVSGQRQAREVTLLNGQRRISQLAGALSLGGQHVQAAQRFFMLAVQHNFTQGRRLQNVTAACLYIVCRRFKTPHMLIDFSDVLQTSVYVLGSTFLKLCRALSISPPLIDPSLYIHRFAAQLEFEEKEQEVVGTALRLVQRMKRDWIQIGRRPAGICGAALLISARLHGFRRTQKEVIQVVKICDVTLRKRLYEFDKTPSSSMTFEEFKDSEELCELGAECDPPSFLRAVEDERASKKRPSPKGRSAANSVIERLDRDLDLHFESSAQAGDADDESGAVDVEEQMSAALRNPQALGDASTVAAYPAPPPRAEFEQPQSQSSSDEEMNEEEVKMYIFSPEEIAAKSAIWEELNREYLEKQRTSPQRSAKRSKKPGQDAHPARSTMINWAAVTLQNLIQSKPTPPQEPTDNRVASEEEEELADLDYNHHLEE